MSDPDIRTLSAANRELFRGNLTPEQHKRITAPILAKYPTIQRLVSRG